MRLSIGLLAASAAALTAGAAQAQSVEIRDAVARVTVIPEQRRDVKVEIVSSNPRLPLEIRNEGGRTVVDGGLRRRVRNCHGEGDRSHVTVSGVGGVSWNERPQLVIRTPPGVALSSNGAVAGSIGRSGGIDLDNSGCSSWTIADAAGQVVIHESGAGSIRMGAADRLEVHLSGAGNLHATRVRQGLEARLSGAGGVTVDELTGALEAQVSGVGRVRVASGRASQVRAEVSGVGGVDFDGVADSLDASISGMGGVKVRSVRGPVRKSVSGMGRVTVGDPT